MYVFSNAIFSIYYAMKRLGKCVLLKVLTHYMQIFHMTKHHQSVCIAKLTQLSMEKWDTYVASWYAFTHVQLFLNADHTEKGVFNILFCDVRFLPHSQILMMPFAGQDN